MLSGQQIYRNHLGQWSVITEARRGTMRRAMRGMQWTDTIDTRRYVHDGYIGTPQHARGEYLYTATLMHSPLSRSHRLASFHLVNCLPHLQRRRHLSLASLRGLCSSLTRPAM